MQTEKNALRAATFDQVVADFMDLIEPLLAARAELDFHAWRLGLDALASAWDGPKEVKHALRDRMQDTPTFVRAKDGKVDWHPPGSRFFNKRPNPKRFGLLA